MAFILGLRPAFSRHPPWHICSARNIDAIKNRNWQKRQLFHFSPFVFVSHSSRRGCFLRLHLRVDLDFFFLLMMFDVAGSENPSKTVSWKEKGRRECFFYSSQLFPFQFNALIKPKDQSIKGWIKPQRRQTEGDFSISCKKGRVDWGQQADPRKSLS